MGGVMLLSTSVFFVLELSRLRSRARKTVDDVAMLIHMGATEWGLDMEQIMTDSRREIQAHGIVYVQLLGRGGDELFRHGQESDSIFPTKASVRLPPTAAPYEELKIEINVGALPTRVVRVLGVHMLVGALLVLVIYHRPFLALRRAIDELEATEAQLMHTERLSAIGEMYASLTHEINNPLGIMLIRVKLMLAAAREGQSPLDLERDLEMIERNCARIAEIVRSLLTFTRKTSFEPVETNLNGVVMEVVDLVEKPLEKQGIKIHRVLGPTLPNVRASAHHLQQVFMNLLNNARDAMPQGGIITLRTFREEGRLVAEVQDTGTGIAPKVKERLFEPFFTTKGVGQGTGLGLSVSYGIISAHGGDIEVESEPGQGSLFRLTLPLIGPS